MNILGVKIGFGLVIAIGLSALVFLIIVFSTFQRPPEKQVQIGYRGVGMVEVFHPSTVAAELASNQVPPPDDKLDPSGQKSSEAYMNVQVLKDLDSNEFLRLMNAITTWVAPQQGCVYCHDQENMASDALYTKVVARRMLQMVANINGNWKTHVGTVGVTCYTCHRGNPVPQNIWFNNPRSSEPHGLSQDKLAKNYASPVVDMSSLPNDVLSDYLDHSDEIRVIGGSALPDGNRHSIKQAEWTYGLMVHMSESLGVNCVFCHNSRAFSVWDQSTPQRVTAWYGIRMVRDLNTQYLDPLTKTFPAYRLGPTGDGPKLECGTCHNGVYKPLFGVSMLPDYPELASISQTASAAAPSAAPPAEAAPTAPANQ
jgi:photosynthetic reaction center cytochrome c subunit